MIFGGDSAIYRRNKLRQKRVHARSSASPMSGNGGNAVVSIGPASGNATSNLVVPISGSDFSDNFCNR